jgi:hypothetical protein
MVALRSRWVDTCETRAMIHEQTQASVAGAEEQGWSFYHHINHLKSFITRTRIGSTLKMLNHYTFLIDIQRAYSPTTGIIYNIMFCTTRALSEYQMLEYAFPDFVRLPE